MLGYEEKLERLELLDAVADAGRLAKGLDQLLESLAHADQLDPESTPIPLTPFTPPSGGLRLWASWPLRTRRG